jgi:hypothetical protein
LIVHVDGGMAEGTDKAIVARASRYYRMTRYVVAVVLFGYGIFSIYDGYYNWPVLHKGQHNEYSIFLNQLMGVVLPIFSVLLVMWALRRSRGEYRLEGGVLRAPGHPAVPLEAIHSVDRSKWDRKGIAWAHYDIPGAAGKILLDDFVYDRDGIDDIFDLVERALTQSPDRPVTPVGSILSAKPPPRPKIGGGP